MPLELSDNEMALLTELAAPIDQRLRQDFLRAVAVELEARPSAIGEGAIHRIARQVLGRTRQDVGSNTHCRFGSAV
jgi:hypothetical protein